MIDETARAGRLPDRGASSRREPNFRALLEHPLPHQEPAAMLGRNDCRQFANCSIGGGL
jgi:hypothetical protein